MVIKTKSHLFAKSLSKIMESLTDVKYKIGTTGTLQETKTQTTIRRSIWTTFCNTQ